MVLLAVEIWVAPVGCLISPFFAAPLVLLAQISARTPLYSLKQKHVSAEQDAFGSHTPRGFALGVNFTQLLTHFNIVFLGDKPLGDRPSLRCIDSNINLNVKHE
jgi:hypothetical protein